MSKQKAKPQNYDYKNIFILFLIDLELFQMPDKIIINIVVLLFEYTNNNSEAWINVYI